MTLRSDIVYADDATAATAAGKRLSLWTWTTIGAVVIGVALRAWQYFANASITLDEAAIARNVLDRHLLGLLAPLDYGQIAPPGFLFAVKLASVLFGPAEWALRLTPLAFGVAGLCLFPSIARSLLTRPAAFAATFMFATAIPPIFYSSDLKQYSGDITAALVIIWAGLQLLEVTHVTRRILVTQIALGLGVLFFSQAAVFTLTAAGLVLVADGFLRRRPDRWARLGLACGWALGVLAAIANGYRSMTIVDRVYMHKFWTALFMPHALPDVEPWLMRVARATFASRGGVAYGGTENLHYPFAVFGTLFLVGIGTLLWAHRAKAALIVGPIVLDLAAAAAGAYPLATRVGAFMIPLYLLAVAHGTDAMSRTFVRRRVGTFGCLLLVPLATYALVQRLPPERSEHIRPVMEYVANHLERGDAVWVYYGAGQAFEYYQRLIPVGSDVQIGDCDRQNPRAYLHEVDVERGHRRAWFVFAHFAPQFRFDERGLLMAYLDAIGHRLDEFHAPPPDRSPAVAAVYLYDLSDAGKLARADADTFPITGKATPARWSCYGTDSPIPSRNGAAVEAVLKLAVR